MTARAARLAASLAATALVAGLATGGPASARMLWGANGHPITAYPGIPIEDQIALLADLGMTTYRVNISTADQADQLGAIIAAAAPHGIDILPVLTPAIDIEGGSPETLRAEARAFAEALASRFGAQIPVWELGNELEVEALARPCETLDDGSQYPCDWGIASGTGALDYIGARWDKASAVLRGLSEGVRAQAPEARTAMGSAGWGHVGAFERMLADGLDWDISVWHLYGEDPAPAFEILARYDRPIWVTELNHPSGSQDGDQQQALGLRAMMARLEELAPRYGVEAAHVYELLDEPYWAPSFEAVMGLYRLAPTPDSWTLGEPKPAYGAAREVIRRNPPYRACDPEAAAAAAQAGASADDAEAAGLAAYAQCLALDADPSPEAIAAWADAVAAGPAAMRQTLAAAFDSDAFRARHQTNGLDDAAFVDLLYRLILGRGADPGGRDVYAGALRSAQTERGQVAASLLASDEFRLAHPGLVFPDPLPPGPTLPERACDLGAATAPTAYAYCLVLGRAPTADETAASVDTPPMDLVAALIRSREFEERYGAAALSDADFVRLAYLIMLGRAGDGGGIDAYAGGIAAGGMTRLDVAMALLHSTEGAQRHAALAP